MDKPELSIVIPVLNRQKLGERALRSAVAEATQDMEIIVVDDGSDPPFQIPDDFKASKNIHLIRHPDNLGAGAARNTGFGQARADWIALLDSDDYWLDGTLRPRFEAAQRAYAVDRDILTVHAAGFILDKMSNGKAVVRIPKESSDPLDFASGCWFSPGSTLLARKEVLERIGPYDVGFRRLEDLDLFLRLALRGGRLKVWGQAAAVIATGSRYSIPDLDEVDNRLRAKYFDPGQPYFLPERLARRLRAYLNVERASISARHGRWLSMIRYLLLSWLLVPRLTVHLTHFWRIEPAPAQFKSSISP